MIDKNGKLFGKINIIDLLIILIVIAALAFVCVKFLGKSGANVSSGNLSKVELTFFAAEAPALLKSTANPPKNGDPVTDYNNKLEIGTVSGYSAEDAFEYAYDPESKAAVKVPVANECFLTFNVQADAQISNSGIIIAGCTYSIGGTYVVCAGPIRVECRLADYRIIQ